MTEAAFTPKSDRENVIQVFMEKFNVPDYYVFTQAVLALYATGRTTGLVLDSGDGVTHAVVVYDGYQLKHATQRIDLAGRDVTHELCKRLREENHIPFETTSELNIVKSIKESSAFVAHNYQEAIDSNKYVTSP